MHQQILLFTFLSLLNAPATAADIVARAEAESELRLSSGKVLPRVERDEDGHVTRLRLNDMKLSLEEVAELRKLKQLRSLVLIRTNFTDKHLEELLGCPSLQHLNLTSSEVTDSSIDSIHKLQLMTLCIGDVQISAQSVQRLRDRNQSLKPGKRLRWGYSQRKE